MKQELWSFIMSYPFADSHDTMSQWDAEFAKFKADLKEFYKSHGVIVDW